MVEPTNRINSLYWQSSDMPSHLHNMKVYEEEYVDFKQLRIFVGTWNVNGQPPHSVPVGIWLNCDPFPPDVYAIGFQELDLSKEAYLFNGSLREQEWLEICYMALHPKGNYVKLKLVRLVGMMLMVFVKRELSQFITNVAAETVGTGLMNMLGNKGAVAIRLELHNTSICFINSHLAAHGEECARRNQDYHEICSRIVFTQFQHPLYIMNHDQIYWLGDLNYRIDDLSTDEIKALVDDRAFKNLLAYDQLKKQMEAKRVFEGFEEPPISHPPTYKYNPGTSEWDTSEKNRPPAWCDRILFRGGPIQPLLYRSHPRLLLSDHKPVSCLFSASVKVVDEFKFKKVYEKVMKILDSLENQALPQVVLNKLEFNFDNVTPTEPSVDTLIVTNTGQVPVYFEFVKKLDNPNYCQKWLQIIPYEGHLKPGDKMDVKFRVFLGDTGEHSSDSSLDDILILHLERGKDIFISVKVNQIRHCDIIEEDEPLIQL